MILLKLIEQNNQKKLTIYQSLGSAVQLTVPAQTLFAVSCNI
jgi:hypothetical protein